MRKILAFIMTLLIALNFFTGETFAKTEAEKAEQKEAKLQKKLEKQIAKAAKKLNLEKIIAWAESGDIQAQIILSYAYQTGQRVTRNSERAKALKESAAAKNWSLVENFIPKEYGKKRVELSRMFGLAAVHSHFKEYLNASDEDSIRWAELGASEKDTLSLAYLGSAYYTGRGAKQDYKLAVDYLKKAGEEILALQLLSDAYKNGNGVEKDPVKSKIYSDYAEVVASKKNKRK